MARCNRLDDVNSRKILREGLQPLVLVLVTLVVGLPLCFGRSLAGHDVFAYMIHAQQTMVNLRAGEIFPAWGGDYYAGYGSPALLFFPPLTSYANAIVGLMGVPVVTAVCGLALVAYLASGLAMLGWIRSKGLRVEALPAAVMYMVAPYRLIDLYPRTAIAEHWAFIWPPLILWVAGAKNLRALVRIPVLALLVAALLLTNLPLAVLFGLGLGVWYLFTEDFRGRRLQVAAGAGLGFAIASFALVPQAMASSLLAIEQFFGSEAGPYRVSQNTLYSAGFAEWNFNTTVSTALLATFALAVLAYLLIPRSERSARRVKMAMVGALICVLSATGPVGKLWDHLPILSNLQFPWRVAALLTLIVAFLTARLAPRRAWKLVFLTAVVAIPFLGWSTTLPRAAFANAEPPQSPPGSVFPDPHAVWEASSGGWFWEHENLVELCLVPENMKPFLIPELMGVRSRELDAIRDKPAVVREDRSASVRVISWGPVKREIEVNSPNGGTLIWRAISFPDMSVEVDGREVPTHADPVTGLLANPVPPGDHRLEWRWQPFPALQWGRRVTIAALTLTVGLLIVAGLGWVRSR
jgi:hypothetical protein